MPRKYVEYKVMKEMGWSYQELQETPSHVVEGVMRYMNTEAKWEQIKRGRT